MNKKSIHIMYFFVLFSLNLFGQNKEDISNRIQALKNGEYFFYNIDGYEISQIKKEGKFSPKSISRTFKKLKIESDRLIKADSLFRFPCYYTHNSQKINENIKAHSSYYFFQTEKNSVTAITFDSYNKPDLDFQNLIFRRIFDKKIPPSAFSPITADSINFGGRYIRLGGNCRWMNINNMQCSGHGQMNWSVFYEEKKSIQYLENHRAVMELKNNGKVVSDEQVNVVFEGQKVTATKLVWDFTGVSSVLVGMTGGKTLTIYFVSAPVRGNHISCVMSYWNNDYINSSGLPQLLNEVMKFE